MRILCLDRVTVVEDRLDFRQLVAGAQHRTEVRGLSTGQVDRRLEEQIGVGCDVAPAIRAMEVGRALQYNPILP